MGLFVAKKNSYSYLLLLLLLLTSYPHFHQNVIALWASQKERYGVMRDPHPFKKSPSWVTVLPCQHFYPQEEGRTASWFCQPFCFCWQYSARCWDLMTHFMIGNSFYLRSMKFNTSQLLLFHLEPYPKQWVNDCVHSMLTMRCSFPPSKETLLHCGVFGWCER